MAAVTMLEHIGNTMTFACLIGESGLFRRIVTFLIIAHLILLLTY